MSGKGKLDMWDELKPYKKIFDIVRVVDSNCKEVVYCNGCENYPEDLKCYSLWEADEECQNCICTKSLKERKSFVKIQHNKDNMFLMFTTFIEIQGETLALELIKDITNELAFETVIQRKGHELKNIVEDLNEVIFKDQLTNLYNRRFINQKLPEEINKCNNDYPLSIAMMDIDDFKGINDSYGHDAGDMAIKELGLILSESLRKDKDWIARYGGDEFLICLPNTDNNIAYKVLDRIRETIKKTKISIGNEDINITNSFGLYTINNSDTKIDELIKLADINLRKAKEEGKNKIVL